MENSIKNNDPVFVQFEQITTLIRNAHQAVFRVANKALIELYWSVGEYISKRVEASQWGKGVVKQLADYIDSTSPDIKGFSASNLWRMKQFYETYAADTKLATLLREISWSNNLLILSRAKSAEEREFYLRLALRDRLSNRELSRQINSCIFERSMLGQAKLVYSFVRLRVYCTCPTKRCCKNR